MYLIIIKLYINQLYNVILNIQQAKYIMKINKKIIILIITIININLYHIKNMIPKIAITTIIITITLVSKFHLWKK